MTAPVDDRFAVAPTQLNVQALQPNLAAALGRVSGAAATKPVMPITTHVLVETMDGRLRLTCTDLDLTISTFCAARVDAEGAACVEAHLLEQAVRSFPPEPVTLRILGPQMAISCGRAEHRLAVLDAADFPRRAEPSAEPVSLSGAALRTVIQRTEPLHSSDASRLALQGIHFQPKDGVVDVMGADGFRLALAQLPWQGSVAWPQAITIPARAARELASNCGDETVLARIEARYAAFDIGRDTTLVTSLIEGLYPDFSKVVPEPEETSFTVTLDAASALAALDGLAPYASRGNGAVAFVPLDGALRMFAWTPEYRGECEVEAVCTRGPRYAINHHFIRDALKLTGKRVIFRFHETQGMHAIRVEEEAGDTPSDGYFQVLMPMDHAYAEEH